MRNAIVIIATLSMLVAASCVPPDEDDQEVLKDVLESADEGGYDEVSDEEWALVCEAQDACEALCEVDNDIARRVYETSASRERKYECAQEWDTQQDCDLFINCLETE